MSEEKLLVLFGQATELPHEARADFLKGACKNDASLLQELESLLVADDEAFEQTFWHRSAMQNESRSDRSSSSVVGRVVGNYRLVELIGRGGMGSVYRAERVDEVFEKSVAIKLIEALFCTPEMVAHFRAERQILAGLEHPNIARLLDGGTSADGLPYLVMEYVEGTSPYEYCKKHHLSIAQRLTLFRQICSAVHFAHQNMVIHRDLKPANLLITADGTPKLLDFGIAKVLSPDASRPLGEMTEPGLVKMTVRYASPEQVRGEVVTTASDVYSLGVLLYELLSEHSPYGDADRPAHELMGAVCDQEPVRPSTWERRLKGDLDNIILMALRKRPLERYASANQFSEDILRYLEERPIEARAHAPFYVAARFIRRNRVLVSVSGLLLLSLVVGLVEVVLARGRAERRFNQVRQLAHAVMFDYSDAIDRLPGSTPVRARLVADALGYLDSFSREADTPELQREIVDAYVRISNVQGNEYENNLGDTAAAAATARKATTESERLLRRDKGLPALASAASAFSAQGSLNYAMGEMDAAGQAYLRAVELYQRIAKQEPANVENKIALSTCFRHLGDLYGGPGFNNLGNTVESLAYYQQDRSLVEELATAFPYNVDVTKELYKTLISLSASETAVGKHREAKDDLGDAITAIRKVSATDANDVNVRVELAVAESRLGQVLTDDRNFTGAVARLVESEELLEGLLRANPGNTIYRRGQSVVETQLAAALRGTGDARASLGHSELALTLARSLSKDAPQSAQYRTDVGVDERKLSDGLLQSGEGRSALHHAEEAEKILCKADRRAADPNAIANCGRVLLAKGNAFAALNAMPQALSALQDADRMFATLAMGDPMNVTLTSDWARVQEASGDTFAKSGDQDSAYAKYHEALQHWSGLQQRHLLSAEDTHRSEMTANALRALPSKQ